MDTRSREPTSESVPAESVDAPERPEVSCCETVPGKYVFVEADESDGWIATDAPVDVRR